MKKKILIIIILLLIIILAFLILSGKSQAPGSNSTFVPSPNIPVQLNGGQPTLNLTLKESDFSFPKTIPLLEASSQQTFSEQDADSIASNLGFTGSVIKTQDANGGDTFIWSNESSSLVVYSKTQQIEYSINNISQTANKQLSNTAITKIAQDYLSKFNLTSSQANFSYFSFLNANSETTSPTTKDRANVYQVNFTPIQLDLKLLTINPQQTPIYVWILPDGTIARVHIVKMNLQKTQQTYPVKDFSQFKSTLNKAVLVNLDNGNLSVSSFNASLIQSIDINSVEIVYLVDDINSPLFQPVFLLKGSANIAGQNKIDATLYLPALVNQ